MSFKIKNSQLSNDVIIVINNLIEQDINASAAFKLTRIIKYLSSIIEDKVNLEKRIFDKWVDKDENGNIKIAKDEKGENIEDTYYLKDIDLFSKEINELLSVENEIPYDKLDFYELNLESAKIKDLIKIDFLFK